MYGTKIDAALGAYRESWGARGSYARRKTNTSRFLVSVEVRGLRTHTHICVYDTEVERGLSGWRKRRVRTERTMEVGMSGGQWHVHMTVARNPLLGVN